MDNKSYYQHWGLSNDWTKPWLDRVQNQSLSGNWDYYFDEGHFSHWIGVKPDNNTEEGKQTANAIARMFQSINVVKEVIDHFADVLLSKEPLWTISKGDNDQEKDPIIDEVTKQIKRLLRCLQSTNSGFFLNPLYAFVVSSLVEGTGYIRITTLPEYEKVDKIAAIAFHCPHTSSIEVLKRDGVGRPLKIKYHYIDDNEPFVEIQELREDGLTYFSYQKYKEQDNQKEEYDFAINLNGKLSIVELRRRSLISVGVKAAQDAINHAATLIPRNNELSGFYSTIFMNARPPGKFVVGDSGEKTFQPDRDALVIAPGVINFVSGLPIKDETGKIANYTTPTIHTNQPIPVDSFEKTVRMFSTAIYRLVGQEHRLSQDLVLSGKSREELRSDFQSTVEKDASILQLVLSQLLMTAFYMSKRGEDLTPYQEIDLSIKMQVRVGLPSSDERREIRENYKAGLMSKRTAIAAQQYVEDPQTELDRIEVEENSQSETQESQEDN